MATDNKRSIIAEYVIVDKTSASLSVIGKGLGGVASSAKLAKQAQDAFNKALKETNDVGKAVSQTFDQLNAEAQEYSNRLVKSVDKQKDYIKTLRSMRDASEVTTTEHTRMSAEIQKLTNSLTQFQRDGTKLTKVNGDMQSSTGLASAAVIEFGRGVSDAGFGITGVANNVQQFASMFIALRQESDGTKGALKAMTAQFMGPLGLLVAFQGAIALIEFLNRKYDLFGQKADETSKKLQEQKVELVASTAALRGYAMVLDDVNSSEEARKVAVEEITKVLPNLTEEELNSKDALKLTNDAIEEYIRNQSIRLEIDSLIEENQELFSAKRKLRSISEIEDLDEQKKALNDFLKTQGTSIKKISRDIISEETNLKKSRFSLFALAVAPFMGVDEETEVKKVFKTFNEEVESEYAKTIDKISKLQAQLTDSPEDTDKKTKSEKEKRDALLELIEGYNKKQQELDSENDQQLLELERIRAKEEAEELGANKEQLLVIEKYYDDLSYELFLENANRRMAEREKQDIKEVKAKAKVEREKLRIEKQSVKARENVQLQSLSFSKSLATMFSNIANEDKTLKAISFILQKGSAIAEIIVKANASIASQKIANAAANQAIIAKYAGVPFGGALAVKESVAAKASLVKDIARTKRAAAFSIASIAATSIKGGGSTASGEAGGGGAVSSPAIEPPQFNIVGASAQSQLAQTIAQAEQQPTRAYVVAEDITSAQQLDRETIQGASLG